MAGQNAGTITYDVTADTSKLKADVAKATGEVNAVGAVSADRATEATNKQAAATSALGERLRGVKKTYGEQIEVVQGLLGKFVAIGATVAIAYKVGQAIREYIVDALATSVEKAQAFKDTLNLADVQGSFRQVNEQVAELQSRLAASTESGFANFLNTMTGDTQESLRRQIADLQQLQRSLAQTQRAAERRQEAEKDAARRKEEEDILARLDEEGRAGRQRIDDEQQKRREAFEDFQAQIREIARQQEEAAAKVRDSWAASFRAIREESNRAFATDQAASMVQLAGQLRIEGMTAAANMNQIVVQGVG
ncbi:MAG: hypothetical protein EBR82_44470 [Caulobacteraceae bacterium]|nr:hypothetical protein [Caulobacteraceae bacterium]